MPHKLLLALQPASIILRDIPHQDDFFQTKKNDTGVSLYRFIAIP